MRAIIGLLVIAALAVALGNASTTAAAAGARASGGDQPAGRNCIGAEEASARTAGDDGGGGEEGGEDDEGGDEGAPPRFTPAFYARTFTLDASLDGLDRNQLPISIEDVCDVPPSLASQAAQLAGADGVALLSPRTVVYLGPRRLRGRAARTAVDGADTAILRVRLAPRSQWATDEDGETVATFQARRITITD